MKKTKWYAVLAACALALFVAGCKNSSDGPDEPEQKPEPVAVESIDMYKKTLSLDVGVMEKLNVRILPSDATDKTVKWSSSKPEVATVGDDGTVRGVKVGRATITAQAGEITDTCEVTVDAHTHNYVNLKCQTCGFDKPSFKEGDIDDYGTLKAYTGSGTTVAIPKGVTCIGDGVFKGKTSLTSVTLPDGMTRIDSSAFEGCTGLTSMTIPDGVTYIAYHAFKDCTGLASVTIPDSVTDIGSYAFEGCTSLKEIQFTGTMAEWKAIDGSDDVNITCIQCSDGYIGVKDAPAYLTFNGTEVTGYADGLPANLVIPDGVTEIGEKAFKGCTELTSVTIPDSVTDIGDSAFEGCTGLTEVTIGDGVTKIGDKVFEDCKSLTEIHFTGTKVQWNAIDGSDDVNITRIDCNDGYIGVKEVPAYLKISGRTVTGYNDGLPAKLVIPDGVTEIGDSAFSGCKNLESVTIPDSVTYIDSAFYLCSNLATVQYNGTLAQWCAIDNDRYLLNNAQHVIMSDSTDLKTLTELVIPDGATKIGNEAFYGYALIESVTIPDSVTEIGQLAFYDCTSLTKVTIGKGVKKIGYNAFGDGKSLESVKYAGTKAQWNAIDIQYWSGLRGKTITGKDGTEWTAE